MIPDFIDVKNALWPLLPPGIWDANMEEVFDRFAINERRRNLFEGFQNGVNNIFLAGSPYIYLDGSYVTAKPLPNDFEVCWEMSYVDPAILDPVFFVFDHGRLAQKQKYRGEFFPATVTEGQTGKPFLNFFQTDKNSGASKGIIRVFNNFK